MWSPSPVGQVLEIEDADLQNIRNFGPKSLDELKDKLLEFGFVQQKSAPSDDSNGQGPSLEEQEGDAEAEITAVEEL